MIIYAEFFSILFCKTLHQDSATLALLETPVLPEIPVVVSHLGLQYDNGDIKQCYTQKLRLIEPDNEELRLADSKSAVINH